MKALRFVSLGACAAGRGTMRTQALAGAKWMLPAVGLALYQLSGTMPAQAQTTEVHACWPNDSGRVRFVASLAECKTGETGISWNVQGIQGPVGPQGPQGQQGPQGPQGSYRRILVTEGSGGSGLNLRSDNLDPVSEPYTENDFRQLIVTIETSPAFLGRLGELEDHRERGLV